MESQDRDDLIAGYTTSFIDKGHPSKERYRSDLICNTKDVGTSLLEVLKREFAGCTSFDICVAFIAESGLQPLVQALSSLRSRGVRGRILTSTYLNFNKPDVFAKLLEYDNIEVRVYQGNMHAKGYMFNQGKTNTVIIGSSNLTQSALTCNREWNVLFRTFDTGEAFDAISHEYESLWNDELTHALTSEWVDEYREFHEIHQQPSNPRLRAFNMEDNHSSDACGKISPNTMQEHALEALTALHDKGEERALLVSATGTGKTYLSAFEVQRVRPDRVLFLAHRKRILEASLKSYERVLGSAYTYGMYQAGGDCSGASCVFGMCSTLSLHLNDFAPNAFDYIVIDEAHRTGSSTYQKIMSYFTPKFYLGMTATPSRTDGYDVYGLFNHVIAYQITLQDALANDMLVPFHYFGIADLSIDYEEKDDVSLFARLTCDERARHIIDKIEEYTVDKTDRRGLIFCNRNDEASELCARFNEEGYSSAVLSGASSDDERNRAIDDLEAGRIQYIFSVDIFNEGIDIPSVNQIIMLRRTESPIVFLQQLGRGLRKFDGKDYTLVLDFIGNYQKNFFVPVALSGDTTYNKDNLRRVIKRGSSVIPGASTVSFDEVSEAHIYRAIDQGDFTGMRFLKAEYMDLRQKLGRIPALADFDATGSVDPLLIFKAFGSYHGLLKKYEKDYDVSFSSMQEAVLKFISQKLASGKRAEELCMLYDLIEYGPVDAEGLVTSAPSRHGTVLSSPGIASAASVLYGNFATVKDFVALVIGDESGFKLTSDFSSALKDEEFKRQILDVIRFGLHRHYESYGEPYKNTSFVLNAKYSYEDVCRLLGWKRSENTQNIGGYKYDKDTNTFPVFINYDKDPSISDSIKYEDRFVSENELIAISKQPRSLNSPEIRRLKEWPGNGMRAYLFMRKNTNDKDAKEFYFLGEIFPTGEFEQFTMPGTNKTAVEITYHLEHAVRHDIYEYMTSDLAVDQA